MWFNTKRFWIWFFDGTMHSLAVTFVVYFIDTTFHNDQGDFFSFWPFGMMVFGSAVIVGNAKMLVFTNTYNVLIVVVLIGSVLLYILSNVYVSVSGEDNNFTLQK
jgi:phospholipid-transporting ATPase